MKIDSTEFGSITIDGTLYSHDILIRLSGEVVKRKKKLSKKYYGTSHTISLEEAVILKPTPEAIETYNKTRGKARAIGLFHVTC